MSMFFVVVAGLAGGLAAAAQARFLGIMEERVGTLGSVFVTYTGGGIAIGLIVLLLGGGRLTELRTVPWWAWTAGIMGLVVVGSLGVTVNRLGLGTGLTLFTASSLVLAALFDHVGWLGESYRLGMSRLVGVAMVVGGTWLVMAGR